MLTHTCANMKGDFRVHELERCVNPKSNLKCVKVQALKTETEHLAGWCVRMSHGLLKFMISGCIL